MIIDNNLTVTFSMDNAEINKDAFAALCYNMAQVGTSAKEAGEALRKLTVRLYDANRQEFRYASEVLSDLADKWNEIGCINPVTPEEIAQGLLRAETPGTTENPNQNKHSDFLEQNAYDDTKDFLEGDSSGWLIPLDTI